MKSAHWLFFYFFPVHHIPEKTWTHKLGWRGFDRLEAFFFGEQKCSGAELSGADVGISGERAWSAVSWRGWTGGKDRFYGTNLFVCLSRQNHLRDTGFFSVKHNCCWSCKCLRERETSIHTLTVSLTYHSIIHHSLPSYFHFATWLEVNRNGRFKGRSRVSSGRLLALCDITTGLLCCSSRQKQRVDFSNFFVEATYRT